MKLNCYYRFFKCCALWGICIVVLSGCIPYHKIVKGEFPQGDTRLVDYQIIDNYMRSGRVYDGFKSQIDVDALWFSDEMRTLYVNMLCQKKGKGVNARQSLLRRQLEENKYGITFYLLVSTPQQKYAALNDSDPFWSLVLEMPSGKRVQSKSIKEVDLEPDINVLFGDKATDFKRAFLISFPLKEALTDSKTSDAMRLIISSPIHQLQLHWDVRPEEQPQKELIKQKSGYEDFYWM